MTPFDETVCYLERLKLHLEKRKETEEFRIWAEVTFLRLMIRHVNQKLHVIRRRLS